jgi:excisionase family DNA binding protein
MTNAGASEVGPLFTVREVAQQLRVSEKTVRRMAQKGLIAHRRVGTQLRFSASDFSLPDLAVGIRSETLEGSSKDIGRLPIPTWAEARVGAWRTALQRLIPSHHGVHVVVMDRRGAKTFRILGLEGFSWGKNLWHSNAVEAAPDSQLRKQFAHSQVIVFDEMIQHARKLARLRRRLESLQIAVQSVCLVRRRSHFLDGKLYDTEVQAVEDLDDDAFARTATFLSRLLARRAPPMDVEHVAIAGTVSRDPTVAESVTALSEFAETGVVWLSDLGRTDTVDAVTLDRPYFFDPSRYALPDGISAAWTGPLKIRGYYDRITSRLVVVFIAFPRLEGTPAAWARLIETTRSRFGGSQADCLGPCTDEDLQQAYAEVCTDASLELLRQSVDAGLLMCLGMANPGGLPASLTDSVFGAKRGKRLANDIMIALRPMPGRRLLPQQQAIPVDLDPGRRLTRPAKSIDARKAVLDRIGRRWAAADVEAPPVTFQQLIHSTMPMDERAISFALDYELDAGTVQPTNWIERVNGATVAVERAYWRGEFDGEYLRTHEEDSTRRARVVATNALDLWLQHSKRESEDALTCATLLANLVHDWGEDLPALDIIWKPFRFGAMPAVPPEMDSLLPILVQRGFLETVPTVEAAAQHYAPNRALDPRQLFRGTLCSGAVTARVRGLVRAYWAIHQQYAQVSQSQHQPLAGPLVVLASARNEKIAYTCVRYELIHWLTTGNEVFFPALMDALALECSNEKQNELLQASLAELVESATFLHTKLDLYREVPALRKQLAELFERNALDVGDIVLDTVDTIPRFSESFAETDHPVGLIRGAAEIASPFTSLLRDIVIMIGISADKSSRVDNADSHLRALLHAAPEIAASIGPSLSLAIEQVRATRRLDGVVTGRLRFAFDEIVRILKSRIYDLQRDPALDERRRKLELDLIRVPKLLAGRFHSGYVSVGDFQNFVSFASRAAEMLADDLQTIAEKIQDRMLSVADRAAYRFPSCRVVGQHGDTIVLAGPSATDVLLATMEFCRELRTQNNEWDRDFGAAALPFMRFGVAKFDATPAGPTAPPTATWMAYNIASQKGFLRGKVGLTRLVRDDLLDSIRQYLADEPKAKELGQGPVSSWSLESEAREKDESAPVAS